MMDVPKPGDRVRVNAWRNTEGGGGGSPGGMAPDWKEWASPHHTGVHKVVDVRLQADSNLAFLGSPFSDPWIEVECAPGSVCDPWAKAAPLGIVPIWLVPLGAVHPA